jgi:hypothetical protein
VLTRYLPLLLPLDTWLTLTRPAGAISAARLSQEVRGAPTGPGLALAVSLSGSLSVR